jgi:hypothetical protein
VFLSGFQPDLNQQFNQFGYRQHWSVVIQWIIFTGTFIEAHDSAPLARVLASNLSLRAAVVAMASVCAQRLGCFR